MRVETELKLDFDDVLIRPKRSVAPSRASVDVLANTAFGMPPRSAGWTGIPIMAANLDTDRHNEDGGKCCTSLNMLTCLHKFYPLEELIDFFTNNPASSSTFYTLGIREEDFDKLKVVCPEGGDIA